MAKSVLPAVLRTSLRQGGCDKSGRRRLYNGKIVLRAPLAAHLPRQGGYGQVGRERLGRALEGAQLPEREALVFVRPPVW